jgi:hypothetical protein
MTTLNVLPAIRPFHCGSQHASWECANCDRCTKNTPSQEGMPRCEIQRAIFEAQFGDGTISADIAHRMGFTSHLAYIWECGEVEWTEEWKAEYRIRQTLRYRLRKWRWEIRRAARRWIGERRDNLRHRWRRPIAERHGLNKPTTCWAEWCSWALGYLDTEKPERDSGGESCRKESENGGSCWCGKFKDGRMASADVPA